MFAEPPENRYLAVFILPGCRKRYRGDSRSKKTHNILCSEQSPGNRVTQSNGTKSRIVRDMFAEPPEKVYWRLFIFN